MAELWKQIFIAMKVDLLYSTAWHPQTDGVSERSNQTAEIALRYYIAALENPKLWPTVLGRMSAALNNSVKYSSTAQAPTQVLYGFKTREALDLLRIEDPDSTTQANPHVGVPPQEASRPSRAASLPTGMTATEAAYPAVTRSAVQHRAPSPRVVIPVMTHTSRRETTSAMERTSRREATEATSAMERNSPRAATSTGESRVASMDEYRPSHIDAKDAIAFASLKMKEAYDSRHQPIFFKEGELVNLRLHRDYRVPGITSKKIGPQLVGPFKILERIGRLAYKLELPANMRIHDVVSIAHLEPATDPAEDPYRRRRLSAPAVVVDGEEEYEIEKLLRKRSIRRGRGICTQYLVRWLGYGPEADIWELERELLRHAKETVEEYQAANGNAVLLAMLRIGKKEA